MGVIRSYKAVEGLIRSVRALRSYKAVEGLKGIMRDLRALGKTE